MTETLISLISILVGIIAANTFGFYYKKYSFDVIGNSIAGVFGSIFFIKLFGRLGVNPVTIMQTGEPNWLLLIMNLIVSIIGAIMALILIMKFKNKMQN